VSKLTTISELWFDFGHIPIKAWKLLADFCGTTYLWISKTKIDVTVLNDPDLSKIKTLFLVDVGLTEMPCLSSLTGLEHLFLNGNQIGEVNLQSYFDAEKGTHRAMPNLKYLDLRGNPIFSMCTRIREVFTNRSMVIRLNNLRLCHPFSNVKHEMKKARTSPLNLIWSIGVGCHELVKLVVNTDLKHLYLLISSSTFILCTNVLWLLFY
ncbi:uncharacterized protein VICG_00615, partial [Vittaforma corneae ATCC 50505]